LLSSGFTKQEVNVAIDKRLNDWAKHYEKAGKLEIAKAVRTLKQEIDAERLPF
jgi:hypothetical protein